MSLGQPIRISVTARIAMPIDLWMSVAAWPRAVSKVAPYQPIGIVVSTNAAIAQCSNIAVRV